VKEKTPKKIYIDYNQFGIKLQKLYKKVLRGGIPSYIIGIENGGLNISKPLASWLGVQHLSCSIHFYNNFKAEDRPYYANILPIPVDSTNLLLVDDIVDTGTTINYFIKHTGLVQGMNFRIATIHWYPDGKFKIKPDYFIDKKKKKYMDCISLGRRIF
jgi:hypoxanthine phosphoribosyltransferase